MFTTIWRIRLLPARDFVFSFFQFRGENVMSALAASKGEPDHLFHNNVRTFTDVRRSRCCGQQCLYGMSSVFVDVNNDGNPTYWSRTIPPQLSYINKGDGPLKTTSLCLRISAQRERTRNASMGIATGDYQNNG